MPRKGDPSGVNGGHAIAPRLGNSVVTVDQVVTAGGDFREQDRARQTGRAHRRFVQARAGIARNVSHWDMSEWEVLWMRVDKGQ